jgi:hypothetical protein
MAFSPALQSALQALREFAADPLSVVYVMQPKDRPKVLIYPEQIDAHPTDEALAAYLSARIKGEVTTP